MSNAADLSLIGRPVVECRDCGAQQKIPKRPEPFQAECFRCQSPLEKTGDREVFIVFAVSVGALMLLVAAMFFPLAQTQLRGLGGEAHLISGVIGLWEQGWSLLGVSLLLFVLVFPVLRLGLVAFVTGELCRPRHGRVSSASLGRLFRWAQTLRLWAIPQVLLLALLVVYSRLAAQMNVSVKWGGWLYAAGALLSVVASGSINSRGIWNRIRPDRKRTVAEAPMSCAACLFVLSSQTQLKRCPRCCYRLHRRKPQSLRLTLALVIASYILYVPAYLYPMSVDYRPTGFKEHTIISSIHRLVREDLVYLAMLIFLVSVLIPLAKLAGLTWLLLSWKRREKKAVRLRTRLYRLIDEVGHWSYLDVFIVAFTAPLIAFEDLAQVKAGLGMFPFTMVVFLTMLASHWFDPRLLWDAAGLNSTRHAQER